MPQPVLAAMEARPRGISPAVSGRVRDPEDRRSRNVEDDEDENYLSVRELRNQFEDYLTSKVDEIEEQKDSRRYYHGSQLTSDQLRVLRARHQPPMTWNRTGRKINGIVGLVQRMRSDPKAEATSPKSEQGAEIATQSVRSVLSASDWKSLEPWCLLQCGIDGIAGVQSVLQKDARGDYKIRLEWVIGDEYFYDPKSYRQDFTDSRYEGTSKWMDVDEAIELWPDDEEKEEQLRSLFAGDTDMTTNPDREIKWIITSSKRIRLVQHWYKKKGKWRWAFYVANTLIDQGTSPFFDEDGNSASSFDMFAAAVDHDGDRYSFVRNLKGPQDALNQGKSKMLHLANTKLVRSEKGAVDDVETARREVARPDGWVETNPGRVFELVDTKMDLAAFTQFTEDAKAELDAYANSNLASLNGTAITQISGRAIELLRQPGMAELGPFILAQRAWKLRVFRKIWNAVSRYWTKERWIRVNSDDAKLAQWLQVNGLGLDQYGLPAIINAVGALDVNIVLEEGRDVASVMEDIQDQFKGYPPGTFPPQVLVEFSTLPRSEKDKFMQMMAPKPPQQDPAAELMKKLQLEGLAGEVAHTAAKTAKDTASVQQILATAEEKRAKAATESIRPAHMAHGAEIDAATFARDTLAQAHQIATAGQQQPQQASPQKPPAQFPLPF